MFRISVVWVARIILALVTLPFFCLVFLVGSMVVFVEDVFQYIADKLGELELWLDTGLLNILEATGIADNLIRKFKRNEWQESDTLQIVLFSGQLCFYAFWLWVFYFALQIGAGQVL